MSTPNLYLALRKVVYVYVHEDNTKENYYSNVFLIMFKLILSISGELLVGSRGSNNINFQASLYKLRIVPMIHNTVPQHDSWRSMEPRHWRHIHCY